MSVDVTGITHRATTIRVDRLGRLSGLEEGAWDQRCDYLIVVDKGAYYRAAFIELKKTLDEEHKPREQLRRSLPLLEYLRSLCSIHFEGRSERVTDRPRRPVALRALRRTEATGARLGGAGIARMQNLIRRLLAPPPGGARCWRRARRYACWLAAAGYRRAPPTLRCRWCSMWREGRSWSRCLRRDGGERRRDARPPIRMTWLVPDANPPEVVLTETRSRSWGARRCRLCHSGTSVPRKARRRRPAYRSWSQASHTASSVSAVCAIR